MAGTLFSALRIHLVFVTRERHIMHGHFCVLLRRILRRCAAPNIIRQYIGQQRHRLKQLPG